MASVADAVTSIDTEIDKIYNGYIIYNEPPLITEFKATLVASCKRMVAGGASEKQILFSLKMIYKGLKKQCGKGVSRNLLNEMNRYNQLFRRITDLDDIFSEDEKSPSSIGSVQVTINELKEEHGGYMLEIFKALKAMARFINKNPIRNDDNDEIEEPHAEQPSQALLAANFLPQPIFKDENSLKEKPKRTVKFKVDENSIMLRERVNLFRNYEHHFILNGAVDQVKETTSKPCIFLYLDSEYNACVLIAHGKGKSETIRFRDIINTADDSRIIIEKFIEQMWCIIMELLVDNRPSSKFKLKDKMLRLIAANCLNHSTKTPLSHREFNPLNVFQFSSSEKVKEFIKTYFFKEDMRESFSLDDDSYDAGDAYIAFLDNETSEESLSQMAEAISKGYKFIQIKVLPEHDSKAPLNVNDVIDEIRKVYTLIDEDAITAWFKEKLADRAKERMIGDGFGMRKIIFSELIRLYVIANSESSKRLKQQFLGYVTFYYKGERSFDDTIRSIKNLYAQSYGGCQVQPILVEAEAQLDQLDKNMMLEAEVERKQKEKETDLNALAPDEHFLSTLPVEPPASVYTAGKNLRFKITKALSECIITNIEAARLIEAANTKYECLNRDFKTKQESNFDNENVPQGLNERYIQELIAELYKRGETASEVAMCFTQFIEVTTSLQAIMQNADFSAEPVTECFNENSDKGEVTEEESSQCFSGGIYSFLPSPVVSPQRSDLEQGSESNIESSNFSLTA